MKQYKDIIKHILVNGNCRADRTGIGTKSVFGWQNRYNMQDGFPLLTLKKTYFKGIVYELLWFLKGDTNIKYLVDNNIHIWDEWAYERYCKHQNDKANIASTIPVILNQKEFTIRIKEDKAFALKFGNLGPIYGKQWIDSGEVNQVEQVVNTLKTNPLDRGIIVSAWNVSELKDMALRPCHNQFQFYATPLTLEERFLITDKINKDIKLDMYNSTFNNPMCRKHVESTDDNELRHSLLNELNVPKYKLSLQLYQRSCDVGLGLPFNIASYSLLLHMVSQVTNMVPHEFIHSFGDVHIYNNSINAMKEVLTREEYVLPTIKLNTCIDDIFNFKYEDIELKDYKCHAAIKIPVAV